jgi:ribosomal protein L18
LFERHEKKKKEEVKREKLKCKKGRGRIAVFSQTSSHRFTQVLTSVGVHGSGLARPSSRALEAPKSKEARTNRIDDDQGRIFDVDVAAGIRPRRRRAAASFFSISDRH